MTHSAARDRDNSDLTEILDSIDMESYLDREGIQYQVTHGSSGTQLNVRECPLCGGSSSKVFINADTGLGNCFHGDCGEGFNKWKFIKAHIDLPNKAVVDHIKSAAREMGWRPKKRTSVAVEIDQPDLAMPDSIELPVDGRNLKYLSDRNIDTTTTRYFHLRYSKDGQFWYKSEDGSIRYQNYSKRIIIPIFDLSGDLVSFQGRDITDKAEKKYLFPPGFSSTGKHVFNGQNAWGAKRLIINEGVFDVMATKIAIDEEPDLRKVAIVGTFGKHLSHGSTDGGDQINKFIQLKAAGLEEVTIMWDGEGGALLAALDAAILLKSLGLTVKIAVLPPGKDPNEVAPSEVRAAFWQAENMRCMSCMLKLKMLAIKRMK